MVYILYNIVLFHVSAAIFIMYEEHSVLTNLPGYPFAGLWALGLMLLFPSL